MVAVNIDLLRAIPLFAKMTDAELTELAKLLRGKTLEANQTLFWMGDAGDDFFIIHSGRVEISQIGEDGKENIVAILNAGHFFGELALLDGGRRSATARTKSATELLALSRGDFEKFILAHAAAAWHILVVLGQRQRETLDKLRGIKNANEVIEEKSSRWERFADFIASSMTTPYFILIQICIIIVWILINHFERDNAFDAYPYALLALILGIEAIILTAFILVSQGRQSERDHLRSDLDYQVNVKAHLEVMQLHQKLDKIADVLKRNDSADGPPNLRA